MNLQQTACEECDLLIAVGAGIDLNGLVYGGVPTLATGIGLLVGGFLIEGRIDVDESSFAHEGAELEVPGSPRRLASSAPMAIQIGGSFD